MGKIIKNGIEYASGSNVTVAKNIIYDNTSSGMESTNVQNAISELNNALTSLVKTNVVNSTITIPAHNYYRSKLYFTVEDGYMPFCITSFHAEDVRIIPSTLRLDLDSNGYYIDAIWTNQEDIDITTYISVGYAILSK